MSMEMLVDMINEWGYLALFFSLWLGIAGMPVPDEVIVMSGGAVTAQGWLQPVPAFLLTYLGVVSGLSIGYVLGRIFGSAVLSKIKRKPKLAKYLDKSEALVERYGHTSLIFSYFIPIVRHLMPYVVGVNRMPFARYALFSFTTGLGWTALFFILGHLAGSRLEIWVKYIYAYSEQAIWLILVVIACLAAAAMWYKKSRTLKHPPS